MSSPRSKHTGARRTSWEPPRSTVAIKSCSGSRSGPSTSSPTCSADRPRGDRPDGRRELITMTRSSTHEDIAMPVPITAGAISLEGDLAVPADASGIVVFAHGSGSGRHSPRNRFVAEALQAGGLATLLFDLLR